MCAKLRELRLRQAYAAIPQLTPTTSRIPSRILTILKTYDTLETYETFENPNNFKTLSVRHRR